LLSIVFSVFIGAIIIGSSYYFSTAHIVLAFHMQVLINLWILKVMMWVFCLTPMNIVTTASCWYHYAVIIIWAITNITSRPINISRNRISCCSCCSSWWTIHLNIKYVSMWVILSKMMSISCNSTDTYYTLSSCHSSTATTNIILGRAEVKIALIPLLVSALVWCEVLVLWLASMIVVHAVIWLTLGRRVCEVVLLNLLVTFLIIRILILFSLAFITASLVLSLFMSLFNIIITDASYAVTKLTQIKLMYVIEVNILLIQPRYLGLEIA